jgi:4-hydroxy-tetrahydrodipicolinate synthase
MIFTGSGVAIITPFKENEEVNFEKLAELIEFQIENKTDAIIITGTTGEASTLDDQEHLNVIKCAVDTVNGRVPVIAGTGSNDTKHGIELSVAAEKVGVDALLQVTPYYNKANNEGLIKHFEKIVESVNIPTILYNVPSRTGMNIPVEVMAHLSKNEKIIGIKEASGNISYASEIARLCNDNFAMYSGNDDIIVPMLSIGSKGVISVVANIMPEETHNIVEFYLNGEVEKSRDLQLQMKPFIDSLFIETNPIPIKKAMNLKGFEVGGLRLPLCEMSEKGTAKLAEEMKKIGLLEG